MKEGLGSRVVVGGVRVRGRVCVVGFERCSSLYRVFVVVVGETIRLDGRVCSGGASH
jgi:hypothetical protein